MLIVASPDQSSQFVPHLADPGKRPLQSEGLEPAIPVFDGAIALQTGFGDEDGFHTQTQDQPNDPVERTGIPSGLMELASVIELGDPR